MHSDNVLSGLYVRQTKQQFKWDSARVYFGVEVLRIGPLP